MENICENCTHWKNNRQYPVRNATIGECGKVTMFWDSTEWVDSDKIDPERDLKPEFKDNKAFVQDGSDYIAHFLTKADFGCNQFSQ